MKQKICKDNLKNINNLQFKSSPISIIDDAFKISWLATFLIITNFAIIASKINEFNKQINVSLNIDTNVLIIVLLIMFIIVIFIFFIIKWKIFKIEIDDKKIIVYKNIIIKDKYVFLLENISGYVIEQNILDKIFNVYRFKIYTERIHNSKFDTQFVVKRDLAKKINSLILNKITTIEKKDIIFNELPDSNIKLNLKEIFIHSIFNISVKNSFIILNVILLIFTMIKDGTITKEIITNLLGFIITILTIVFPILYSIIISIIKFYGYKLKKIEDCILVKYGLFTTKNYFIPTRKIRGMVLKETLISRIFKYNMLQVICSGIANQKGELNFLLPMESNKKLNKKINIILPNVKIDITDKLKKQPSFTISIFIAIFTICSIMIIPCLMFFRIKTTYITIYMIGLLVVIIACYLFKRISVNDDYILISTGVFIKKASIILYDSVKYMKVTEGFISNIFNIKILSIYITSNFKDIKQSLGYVNSKTLDKVSQKIYRKNKRNYIKL